MANIFDILKNSRDKDVETIKINKVSIEVQNSLTVDGFASCVYSIADSCFNKKGEYKPEYKEVAKRWAYIKFFTNISLDGISIEELFKVSQAEWWDELMKHIASTQIYYSIESMVDEVIQSRLSSRKTSFDILCDELVNIAKTDMSDQLKNASDILSKLNRVDKRKFVKAVIDNEGGEPNGKH